MAAKRKKTVEELEKENLALQRQNKELLLKNEILSIQTEYLKKLDALVSEREKSEKKKSHRQ